MLTNADGKFTIDKLRRGTYALVVDGPRGASRGEKTGVKTGDTVTIELTTLGTLTGHVTVGGAPVTVVRSRVQAAPPADSIAASPRPTAPTCSSTSRRAATRAAREADQGTAKGNVDVPAGSATLDLVDDTVGVGHRLGRQRAVGPAGQRHHRDRRRHSRTAAGSPTCSPARRRRPTRAGVSASSASRPAAARSRSCPRPAASTRSRSKDFTAGEGQLVDVGTIKVVPPRNGDAGTFGLVTAPKDGKLAVVTVAPGGPAEQAGITTADVITAARRPRGQRHRRRARGRAALERPDRRRRDDRAHARARHDRHAHRGEVVISAAT